MRISWLKFGPQLRTSQKICGSWKNLLKICKCRLMRRTPKSSNWTCTLVMRKRDTKIWCGYNRALKKAWLIMLAHRAWWDQRSLWLDLEMHYQHLKTVRINSLPFNLCPYRNSYLVTKGWMRKTPQEIVCMQRPQKSSKKQVPLERDLRLMFQFTGSKLKNFSMRMPNFKNNCKPYNLKNLILNNSSSILKNRDKKINTDMNSTFKRWRFI